MIGKVKSYSRLKGYGFIRSEEKPNEDVFFHYTEIQMEGFKFLNKEDDVVFEYDLINRQAVNVRKK